MSKNRKEKSVWERTSVQCLYRHGKSGRYYLRTKSGKKEIWRSLKTTTWSVAKLRLADQLKDIRQARGSNRAMESGEMTMTDCVRIYRDRFEGNGDLSEGTRHVRRTALNRLVKTWPGFGSLKPQQVTAGRVYEWAARLKRDGTGFSPPGSLSQSERTRGISPSSVNQAVATLKRVLNVAVESGAIYANPADAKPPEGSGRLRARESSKKIRLPGKDEFFRLFEEMESSGSGWAPYAADLSRFLAFSGVRVGEARRMTWGHVDFDGEVLHVPGTKSETSVRTVPMIDMMKDLLTKIRKREGYAGPGERILKVGECQKSIDRACAVLGIERITHHDLRHLFATVCIESGVDIPTVSRWLGHKDGGALAMRVYGHLRDEHSRRSAAKVKF